MKFSQAHVILNFFCGTFLKIILCSTEEEKSHTGLELHKSKWWQNSHFWVNYLFEHSTTSLKALKNISSSAVKSINRD